MKRLEINMILQIIFLTWMWLVSLTTAALTQFGSQVSGAMYPTSASQKNMQAQITSLEEKLRHMDDVRTWTSTSRFTEVLRRLDTLDNRAARIEVFLERKMDGLQDKLAYLEGKLETRLDKIQASLDMASTRSDRGIKLITNKVVDLERTVASMKHYCNTSSYSTRWNIGEQSAQMQNDNSATEVTGCNGATNGGVDCMIDRINKNIVLHVGNVTNKLNNWYNDLWRRSNSIESALKNENNQSRWEVYDGIMQILNRWEISDETIHEIESSTREHFSDITKVMKDLLRSFSDKETKLAGILDAFLDVLVYNATRTFSEIQLTQELIKSHNSHMGRTFEMTNKLVLSCQEDNKELKGALLLTGAQYKLEWDEKHNKLQDEIALTKNEVASMNKQIADYIRLFERTNNISKHEGVYISALRNITERMIEITSSLSKAQFTKNNSNENGQQIDFPINTRGIDKSGETSLNDNTAMRQILGNATQVYNFLSGFKDVDTNFNRDITKNYNRKSQSSTMSPHTSIMPDYADSFATESQDYDDADDEYME